MQIAVDRILRNAGAIDKLRIAAFTKYDREAASTRQRILQYLPAMERAGIEVDWHPLLDADYVRSLATGHTVSKFRIGLAYIRRLGQLLRRPRGDVLWIYAELFPYLPGWAERLAFLSGRPVVYDFDDAFFIPYEDHRRPLVRRLLAGKLDSLMAGAAACCCGNQYLRDHAAARNNRAMILPTVVDTDLYVPAASRNPTGPLVVGWIGSPTTWHNVRPLLQLLRSLCETYGVRVRVIGAGIAAEQDRFVGLDLIDWTEAGEVLDVQAMDIGIMPLLDLPFQRGKSGYKLIQYMASGVPVVASPVGVNRQIVVPGENGFLATGETEWREALTQLIADGELRARLGSAGRAAAVANYSLASQAPRLIDLFRSMDPAR